MLFRIWHGFNEIYLLVFIFISLIVLYTFYLFFFAQFEIKNLWSKERYKPKCLVHLTVSLSLTSVELSILIRFVELLY